jgi:hypothetical protein
LVASLVLGVLVALWHAPLFATGIYVNLLLHVLFLISTTVLYTLLSRATGGSVLLAMMFHTSWNLMPEIVLLPWFGTPEFDRALILYLAGGIAVSLVATILAWRWLSGAAPAAAVVPAAAPAAS